MSDWLQTYEPDDCCGARLGRALEKGKLDDNFAWLCPKCGQEWRAKLVQFEGVIAKHWAPHCQMELIRQ